MRPRTYFAQTYFGADLCSLLCSFMFSPKSAPKYCRPVRLVHYAFASLRYAYCASCVLEMCDLCVLRPVRSSLGAQAGCANLSQFQDASCASCVLPGLRPVLSGARTRVPNAFRVPCQRFPGSVSHVAAFAKKCGASAFREGCLQERKLRSRNCAFRSAVLGTI